MNSLDQILSTTAPFAAAIAAFAGAILAAITAISVLRYSRSKRRLEDLLIKFEDEFDADLSISNDREIRKILVYLSNFDAKNYKRFDTKNNILFIHSDHLKDYYVFTKAFDELESDQKVAIIDNLRKESAIDRMKYIRNMLVHAHHMETRQEVLTEK